MAYPNTPGDLPSRLYRDMSSLRISSPRAGHARVSPYPRPSDHTHAVGSPRRSLPPELYNGMSSMHVSSPYQSHAGLPPVAWTTPTQAPVDQKPHNPYCEYHPMTLARSAQFKICKSIMQEPKVDDVVPPSRRCQPGSATVKTPQNVVAAARPDRIKTEDVGPQATDLFEYFYPQSSQKETPLVRCTGVNMMRDASTSHMIRRDRGNTSKTARRTSKRPNASSTSREASILKSSIRILQAVSSLCTEGRMVLEGESPAERTASPFARLNNVL
ncbi:hypothetical protein DENSPDRAFT_514890 [Dentipellis sp. KUC8613]|nr:hypothetical protein DENSPDRAFT_514890 [Dentipellis sp. KUC8613]